MTLYLSRIVAAVAAVIMVSGSLSAPAWALSAASVTAPSQSLSGAGLVFHTVPASELPSANGVLLVAGTPKSVGVTGLAGIPSTAAAVELNVRIEDASADAELTLAADADHTAQMPVVDSVDSAWAIDLALGSSSGVVTVSISDGSARVRIEALGYASDPLGGSGLVYHSQSAPGVVVGPGSALSAGTPIDLDESVAGLPANAAAIDLFVTVSNATASANVSITPDASASVVVSSVQPGRSTSIGTTLPVVDSAHASLAIDSGDATVSVVELGYWTDAGSVPGDALELTAASVVAALSSVHAAVSVPLTGVGPIPATGVTAEQLVIRLDAPRSGSLTLARSATSRITVPYPAGQSQVNLDLSLPSTGKIKISATGGSPQVTVTALGYFRRTSTTLVIAITHLPGGVAGEVKLTSPTGHARSITSSTVLSGVSAGSWQIEADPVVASADTYYPAAPTGTAVVAANSLAIAAVDYANAVPETTRAIPSSAVQSVSTGTTPTLTVDASDPVVAATAVGDTVTVGVTEATPAGMIGKVTAVADGTAGTELVTMRSTTLLAGIPQGSIDADGPLGADDVMTPASRPRVLTASVLTRRDRARAAPASVLQSINRNLHCYGGGSLKVTGSVTVSPRVSFHASWGLQGLLPKVTSAVVAPTLTETAQLTATANAAAGCSLDPVALLPSPIRFAAIDIQVGPIPVILVPQLQLYLQGSGEISAKVSAGVTQQLTATAGVGYDHGRYYPIAGLANSFSVQRPTVTDDASADISVSAQMDLLLYGVVGPAASLTPGLKLEGHPGTSYRWKLTAYLKGTAKLVVPILKLSKDLGTLFDTEHVIARSGVDLVPAMSAVGAPFDVNSTARFQATVRNTGTQSSTGTITVDVAMYWTGADDVLDTAAGSGWVCDVNSCDYTAALAAGATTPPITMSSSRISDFCSCHGTTITAEVQVDSTPNGGLGPRSADATAPATDQSRVELVPAVSAVGAPFDVNSTARFQATVRNTGTQSSTGTITVDVAMYWTGADDVLDTAAGSGWVCDVNSCDYTAALAAGATTPPITMSSSRISDFCSCHGTTITAEVQVDSTPNGGLGPRSADATAPATDQSRVELVPAVSAVGAPFDVNSTARFQATVRNTGTQSSTGTITVDVAMYWTGADDVLDTAAGSGWVCDVNSCDYTAALAAGATTPPITMSSSRISDFCSCHGTTITAEVQVDSTPNGGLGPRSADATAPATDGTPPVDLVPVVTANQDVVSPGQTASWTVVVHNTGLQASSNSITVDVPFLTSASGSGWSCSRTQNHCITTAAIPAGGALPPITITDTVVGDPDVVAVGATVANSSDQETRNNYSNAYTGVTRPLIDVVPVVTANQDVVSPGQTASWTVVVHNTGLQASSNSITVDVPFLTSASGSGWSCSRTQNHCITTAAIPAGGALPPITITDTVVGDPDVVAVGATVANSSDQETRNNYSNAYTGVTRPLIDVVPVVTANQDVVSPGQTASWTVVVHNTGLQASSNSITVDVPFLTSASGSGWSCSRTQNHCITTAAIPAGGALPPITITDTVVGDPDVVAVGATVANSSDQETRNNYSNAYTGVSG